MGIYTYIRNKNRYQAEGILNTPFSLSFIHEKTYYYYFNQIIRKF